ncbi:MAG: prolyl oligopeptidase family serine peptidase [Hymenobacter sp.]
MARAGIWGHSGGGYATAAALFRYPDFFKVGISGIGQPRKPQLRGRLGRALPRPAPNPPRRHHQLRQPGQRYVR